MAQPANLVCKVGANTTKFLDIPVALTMVKG